MLYNFAGVLNTLFVAASLYGVFLQLKQIWRRKTNSHHREQGEATALLSLNQFTVSFFAYFSFFVYGYSVEPFNHYMVWPRIVACVLVLAILWEIYFERRQSTERYTIFGCSGILTLGVLGLGLSSFDIGSRFVDEGHLLSTSLILAVSLLLAQGYWHQIMLIIRSGSTGAVNIRMSQFILAMDLSTLLLAYSMGFERSWPMVVLAVVSGVTKILIMYLFRWVKLSLNAALRRSSV